MESPLGPLRLEVEGDEVLRLSFAPGGEPGGHPAVEAIEAYFRGDLEAPGRVPVRLERVPGIQILLWLRENVGPGETMTYGRIARLFGVHPRFVGMVMAKNPVPILVPCHRVVAEGGLGGYSGGLGRKRWLLEFEAEGSGTLFSGHGED